ncbi:hypothetical protein QAD02_018907, partial [Eretmocerus hayati]
MSVAINSSPLGGLGQSSWKRKASDDEDERRSDVKKPKPSWYVTLERESPAPPDDDEESIYTVQGYETEYARDTSDTSTHPWASSSSGEDSDSDVSVHVEYELDSRSESDNPFAINSSSSEPENILAVEFLPFCESEGLADDSDASRSSNDSNVRRAAYQSCIQCKKLNTNPSFRYCEKCYQLRKTNFPRDPPRRRSRARKNQSQEMSTMVSIASTQELCEMDSGIVSSQCEMDSGLGSSQDLGKFDSQGSDTFYGMKPDELKGETVDDRTDKDCNMESIIPSSQESGMVSSLETPLLESQSSGEQSKTDNCVDLLKEHSDGANLISTLSKKLQAKKEDDNGWDSPCLICTVSPKNSAFVHGKIMHVCCCYTCAIK